MWTRLFRYMLDALPSSRWGFSSAAHLLNRAGFGGTPKEIEALAALSVDDAVDRLVDFKPSAEDIPDAAWSRFDPEHVGYFRRLKAATPEERERMTKEYRRRAVRETVAMQHWWLDRMVNTTTPLQEKLTLFWHGHFATSLVKVKEPYLMWRQNALFRSHGTGSWRALLGQIAHDPAMLIWLDQAQSRASHPNENFARELMELFALGEGNYTEKDVTEAARALTGLSLNRATWEPMFRPMMHDRGEKTVLHKTGRLSADDVLDAIASSRQSARFITAKLWRFFAGGVPSEELQAALADAFERQGREFRPFLRTLFRSAEFYDASIVRKQIKSPVQLLVTACRQLERPLPPAPLPSNALRLLGQELFVPPNVKGWDGGVAWINTNTLLTRHNLALLLVEGQNVLPISANRPTVKNSMEKLVQHLVTEPADLTRILSDADRATPEATVKVIERRFLQDSMTPRSAETIAEFLRSRERTVDATLLSAIRLALCTPEYQLV